MKTLPPIKRIFLSFFALFFLFAIQASAATKYRWWDGSVTDTLTPTTTTSLASGPYFENDVLPDADKSEITDYGSASNMCWAGAAANSLHINGWGSRGGFQNEQEIYAYFRDIYSNDGGNPTWAWIDFTYTNGAGANAMQDEDGLYISSWFTRSSADYVSKTSYTDRTLLYDFFFTQCGSGISNYKAPELSMQGSVGHSVSLWGIEYDDTKATTDINRYKALYITDNQGDTYNCGINGLRKLTLDPVTGKTDYSSYVPFSIKPYRGRQQDSTTVPYGKWQGTTSEWSTSGNWVNWNIDSGIQSGSDVPLSDTAAEFGDLGSARTIDTGANREVARLIFNSSADYTIGNDATYSLTFGRRLFSPQTGGFIVQKGTGTVTVNSNIKLRDGLGDGADFSSSGTIRVNSGYKVYGAGSGKVTLNGAISSIGRLATAAQKANTIVKDGSFTLALAGANSFIGDETVGAWQLKNGTLEISNAGNLGANTNDVAFNGAATLSALDDTTLTSGQKFSFNSTSTAAVDVADTKVLTMAGITDVISGIGSFRKQGAGEWILAGNNPNVKGTTCFVDGGSLTIANGNNLGRSYKFTIASGGKYTSVPTVSITGNGTGATATAVMGVGSVSVAAAGSGYTDGTKGVYATGGGGTDAKANITVTDGVVTDVVLTAAGSGYTSPPIFPLTSFGAGTGGLVSCDLAIIDLTFTDGGQGYSVAPTFSTSGGGQIQAAVINGSFPGIVLQVNGGKVKASSPLELGHSITLGAAGGSFVSSADSMVVKSLIGGSGALTKEGVGTVEVTGSNTYSGDTAITAGTLKLGNASGSATGTGAVTVHAGTTLSGSGAMTPAINKSVTVNGTIEPTGTMAIGVSGTGKLAMGNNSRVKLHLGTTSGKIDLVNSADALTDGGSVALEIVQEAGFNYGNTYVVFDRVSSPNFTFESVTGYNTTDYGHQVTYDAANKRYVLAFASKTVPPIITQEPAGITINNGMTSSLSVLSTGYNVTYQWYQGNSGDMGNPIPGATSPSYTTPTLSTGTYQYWVRVQNGYGGVNSATATVTAVNPPTISVQPSSQSALFGNTATMGVTASGTGLSYQWYEGASGNTGNPIAGATSSSYTTGTLSGNGLYWVRITNADGGWVDSSTVTLTMPPSIQSVVRTSANTLLVSFSEEITSASANIAANYSLSGGVTISAPDRDASETNKVTLTTSAMTTGNYTLTVNNLQDVDGNDIATDTQFVFFYTTADYTVTSAGDSGAGTLRDIVAVAFDGAVIDFHPNLANQTITLTSGEILIDKNLTLLNPMAPSLVISGNDSSRIFNIYKSENDLEVTVEDLVLSNGRVVGNNASVYGGAFYNQGELVTLNRVTVRDSQAVANATSSTRYAYGAGIASTGDLTMTECVVQNNTATGTDTDTTKGYGQGGGIYSNGGILTLEDCDILDNTATGQTVANADAGGIYINTATLSVSLSGCLIAGNDCPDRGAGIYINSGANAAITISESAIENNTTLSSGGGIYFLGDNGASVTVSDSLLTGNQAEHTGSVSGGAIYMSTGTGDLANFLLVNSTVSGNAVNNTGGGSAYGGAIYLAQGTGGVSTLSAFNSTIVGNSSSSTSATSGRAGGVYANAGRFSAASTIVANNTHTGTTTYGPDIYKSASAITDGTMGLAVSDGGSGYTAEPTVTISGGGGTGAEARVIFEGTSIASVTIIDGGSGYTSAPTVAFTASPGCSCGGSGATGTATVSGGVVTGVIITSGGTGYDKVPAVTFSGGGGTGATAGAALTPTKISGFSLTKAGAGYTTAPAVSITGGGGSGATATATASIENNLIKTSTGGHTFSNGVSGNIIGQDPMLGALADNGGATNTRAILYGSPAVDAGANPQGLGNDPRGDGYPRVVGSGTDIGAYEAAQPVVQPEIAVTGNGQAVADGSITPTETNHTDFGSAVASGSASVTRTFTIANSGAGGMALSGIALSGTNAADFAISAQPASYVAPGESTTVQVSFDPTAVGVRTATLTISCNDADESAYDFAIQGTGLSATFVVTSNADSSAGSLRDQIAAAGAGDTVTIDPSVTNITLASEISVSKSLTINGAGATISGNNATRIFNATAGTLTLENLVLTNGYSTATTSDANGGAILNNGATLTLENCVVQNSVAIVTAADGTGDNGQGGGISQLSGSLTLKNTTVKGNTANTSGGTTSTFQSYGGGIYVLAGDVTVIGSTISGNQAIGATAATSDGGGLYLSTAGTSTIVNSTVSGNSAADMGGAIYVDNGAVVLYNSTVTANSSAAAQGSIANTTDGTISAISSIVFGATVGYDIETDHETVQAKLTHCLWNSANCAESTTAYANVSAAFNAVSCVNTTDAKLGALADNGGLTWTHALQAESPALNVGSNPQSLTTDQRGAGYNRIVGGVADIGAFEMGVSAPSITSQPAGSRIAYGATASLSASASDATSYQWYEGTSGTTTSPISGATSASYTTPVLTSTTSYWVRATGSGGSVDSTTATVTVNSAAQWVVDKGLAGGNALLTADPDGDGIINLVEYALNTNPSAPDIAALPVVAMEGSNLTITYRKNKSAADLIFVVQSSSDLATWNDEGTGTQQTDLDASTESWKVTKPINSNTKLFLRVKIIR